MTEKINYSYDKKTEFHNKSIVWSKSSSAVIIKSYDLNLRRGG